MLVQPTQDEGASLERLSDEQPSPSPASTSEVPNESPPDLSSAQPSEVPFEQQPDPSPRPSLRPSPTPIVPDLIPEPTGENLGDHSSNDTSLSGNEDEMTLQNVYDLCISLCQQVSDQAKEIKLLKAKITKLKKQANPVIKHHRAYLKSVSLHQRFPRNSYSKKHRVHKESVSKQGRKKAKGESTVQKDPLFDEMPEDKIDHMETENAQSEGRTREKVCSEDDDIPQAVKKFKQLESDEELARKVQEEWEAEEERNKIAEEKATNEALIKNFDDIKARIEADRILAEKLQEQEREQFTIEERAKFLHDTIAAQRKFLAQQRTEAIRNRPPTKNQLRNQMMTYLKHVGNFKHSELKSKKFEDIQAMYEKIKRSDEDFIAIGSVEDESLIKRMNKKDSSKGEEIKQESKEEVKEEDKDEENTRKRKHGTRKKMKSRKRRFKQDTSQDDPSDIEKENDELRLCLTIAPDEDKEVDYEILDKKYPIIDWKTEYLGTKPQFDESKRLEEINLNVVTRSNGQKRYFSTLMRVLSVFDREDLDAVYKLVMDIYQDKIPEGVHTLMTDEGLVIHMLIEKKYPLKKEIVMQMLKLKLESEEESCKDPFSLIRTFIGHKISKFGIEVDRAKVNVIAKLPHPTTVKGVRSFLGHAGFYRRFIQDFSKISRPITHLLEKDTPFVFSQDCINAFETLKKKLTEAPILVVPDWNLPFELMCDASDYAIGAVLGQRKTKHFQPIHYASKIMTEAQFSYTTT
ncbi:reverse transcriptase domain-containing protein [Tanacetum coccineum]